MFKWLHNVIKKRYEVSIVIPTYKNTKFLEECIRSVIKSAKKCSNFEILLGIDNCQDTMGFVSSNQLFSDKHIKLYFFPKNVGPYIIRNTLTQKAMYENILFFDSDDVMMENTIETLLRKFENKEILKFKFYNFNDRKDYKDIENLQISPIFAHGSFLIKKLHFMSMNGFFGWKCGADAEFDERYNGNGYVIPKLDIPLYYRRYHDYNLTRRIDTGIGSSLRNRYSKIILRRRDEKNWTSPEKMDILNPTRIIL
jgi:glycosyltransferase involved in cell wall biosynthesis